MKLIQQHYGTTVLGYIIDNSNPDQLYSLARLEVSSQIEYIATTLVMMKNGLAAEYEKEDNLFQGFAENNLSKVVFGADHIVGKFLKPLLLIYQNFLVDFDKSEIPQERLNLLT